MPSPFPGMNPYLEQPDVWQDFHDSCVVAIRAALTPLVSPNFIVKIAEHIFIHDPVAEERFRIGSADVSVNQATGSSPQSHPNAPSATFAAPQTIYLPEVEFERVIYLEVRDRQGRDIVTIIEMLSPSNKRPGPDRDQYEAKRRGVLHSSVNFVEIDLLRGWPKMSAEMSGDYGILVSVADQRPRVGYWPVGLREPIPPVPIPLRDAFKFPMLDLQAILHSVYDEAFYKDYIYRGAPEPALEGEARLWAERIVQNM